MCNFHKERVVRSAKKEHECYLCGQKIEKGEQYRIMIGVFDGDFYNLKLHGQCHCMVEAYWAEQEFYDEGWDDTMVMEFINQWLREDENIGFWYSNLKASQQELTEALGSSQLEQTNVLMKLRETLTEPTDSGVAITCPSGLWKYPNNALYAVIAWVVNILGLLAFVI